MRPLYRLAQGIVSDGRKYYITDDYGDLIHISASFVYPLWTHFCHGFTCLK